MTLSNVLHTYPAQDRQENQNAYTLSGVRFYRLTESFIEQIRMPSCSFESHGFPGDFVDQQPVRFDV